MQPGPTAQPLCSICGISSALVLTNVASTRDYSSICGTSTSGQHRHNGLGDAVAQIGLRMPHTSGAGAAGGISSWLACSSSCCALLLLIVFRRQFARNIAMQTTK